MRQQKAVHNTRTSDASRHIPLPLHWRQRGLALACVLSLGWLSPLWGQAAPRPKTRLAQHTIPASTPPPALPATPTERVLELSLEDAIRLALQNNLDISRERFNTEIARTQVEQARAAFDPSVGLTTGYSQTRSLPSTQTLQFDRATGLPTGRTTVTRPYTTRTEVTPSFTQKIITGATYELSLINTKETFSPERFGTTTRVANPRYESAAALTFTQPLLKGFGIFVNEAPIRQAQNNEGIAQQRVVQIVLDTIFTVQQGYWELVFRVQDLGAKRESQKLAEDFLAENTIRVELGTLAPIELVQAETQVKRSEGDVITAEAAVREAEDRLKETLSIVETL
ncbi:MAG: TolC family protein, partial [Candidatus Tectomicrobia bacterium]|nr:TolC family protein [Candidatus Tectomicrobia bacterium]